MEFHATVENLSLTYLTFTVVDEIGLNNKVGVKRNIFICLHEVLMTDRFPHPRPPIKCHTKSN